MKDASIRLIQSIEELGKLYDFLNEGFFEGALSKPVITIMPEERKRKNEKVLGWFTQYKVWSEKSGEKAYELNITADYTNRSLHDIAETLLHEMCHQYAVDNSISDCSRGGTYHNKSFAKIASEHGLIADKMAKYGYADTRLSDKAEKIISEFKFEPLIYRKSFMDKEDIMDIIDKKVPQDIPNRDKIKEELYNNLSSGKVQIKPQSSTRKYECPVCQLSVRATKKVNIKCGDCNETMVCERDERPREDMDAAIKRIRAIFGT